MKKDLKVTDKLDLEGLEKEELQVLLQMYATYNKAQRWTWRAQAGMFSMCALIFLAPLGNIALLLAPVLAMFFCYVAEQTNKMVDEWRSKKKK